jgi:hypothetical protein
VSPEPQDRTLEPSNHATFIQEQAMCGLIVLALLCAPIVYMIGWTFWKIITRWHENAPYN